MFFSMEVRGEGGCGGLTGEVGNTVGDAMSALSEDWWNLMGNLRSPPTDLVGDTSVVVDVLLGGDS